MKLLPTSLLALPLALFLSLPLSRPAQAAPNAAERLDAMVLELGQLNGLALACGRLPAVARIKHLVVQRVPKTRSLGEAFETATNASYLELQKNPPADCPDAATLALRGETLAAKIPVSVHSLASTEAVAQGEIVTRYLLQDHEGRGVSDQDFKGRFQLITFGYTFCPDICPTTLTELAAILKALGNDARQVQALFITVDPERDRLSILKNYTEFFDPRILGLSGSPEAIRRTADHFKIRYEKVSEPGAAPDHYSMDHSAGMILLGPDGRFLKKYPYATPINEITNQLRELMHPDAR